MNQTPQLQIEHLDLRHPGVSPGQALMCYEVSCVCLSRYHSPPVSVDVQSNRNDVSTSTSYSVEWSPPTPKMSASYAYESTATEFGAYCLVLAAVENEWGLVALRRAETGTGADYYLIPIANAAQLQVQELDFETALRLEVSGLGNGTNTMLEARLNTKIQQAVNGNSNLPALVGVVGFSLLKILICTVVMKT